jgi:ABC-type multidrug transport system fused ATPase/permease subunit
VGHRKLETGYLHLTILRIFTQGGAILEQGRHHELLAKGEGGAYYDLVKLQNKTH